MKTAMKQVSNPMGYWCAPNGATPDYVICHNFRDFVAYGLTQCWLSSNDDPNGDLTLSRKFDHEDIRDLRQFFLSLLETVIGSIWNGDYEPGAGSIDGDWQTLVIHNGSDDENEVMMTWYPRLDKEAILFDLHITGCDGVGIWLSYEAIEDREKVIKVLEEAEQIVRRGVWDKLYELAADWKRQR